MKIMLTKPLPQPSLGKVIPAGVIINAPAPLFRRLLRQDAGRPVDAQSADVMPAEEPKPVEEPKPKRKKVRRRG